MAAIALAIALPACEKGAGDAGETGSIKAALTVGGERHDVTAVHYKVVGENSSCSDTPLAETTSALEDEALPGSVLPPGSGTHAGADGLFVLPPGNYRVCATPLGANGPSQACAPVDGTVTVLSSATTEVLLVSQCAGADNGGVDVVVALNDPPKITGLGIDPSKFIIACETATVTATAEDPDGDQITYAWSITSSPPGAAPRLQSTDGVANFATDTPGDYQVRLAVTDVHAASSSLTFPIHVSALSCAPLDQCHAAGVCDLDTGACSNPNAPDGTACDDGDANTSSDVCTSGVCAGTTSSCSCPAGFTTLPGGQCGKTYDIDASLLVNQNVSCDGTGANRYNDCNGQPYGFQWTDVGGALGAVTQVDIQFEPGINCQGGNRAVSLNGAQIGGIPTQLDCACAPNHAPFSFANANVGSYVRGGTNTFSIEAPSCEGLSQSSALNGAYARVSVAYSLGGNCGNSCSHDQCTLGGPLDASCGTCVASICQVDSFCCTVGWDSICQNEVGTICGQPCGGGGGGCGNGVCETTESCQSCPADCGACSVCGDGICDAATESCQSCPADCGACSVCGDGICDAATESCQSCAADCGACPPSCPTVALPSQVPLTLSGSTAGLTNTMSSPCAAGNGPEAMFGFTAPADGTYLIDTNGSAFDTVLYLRDSTCAGAPLACDDDSGVGLQSSLSVPLVAGQTIVIVVDGFGSNSFGNYTLNITSL